MNSGLGAGLILLTAYLLGSIPFAVVVSRALGLPDPRNFGSGNPGATNVLRTGSRFAAALTLIGDAGKGAAAVFLCRALGESLALPETAPAWAGAAAFTGHLYPVFLRFHGGKGVATFLGTLLALVPLVGFATCVLWLVVAALFRYSSAASIVSALAASLALWRIASPAGTTLAVALMSLLLVWRHRRNILQLLAGTETKIGQRAASGSSSAPSGSSSPPG